MERKDVLHRQWISVHAGESYLHLLKVKIILFWVLEGQAKGSQIWWFARSLAIQNS